MKDWGVYVTDNPESGKWTHYKTITKADLFDWATGDGAYAGQVVVDDAGTADTADDWFYYYVPVKDRNAAAGADPFSIGVAKSKSPLGPWVDAIGAPLLTTTQTQIETIDPAFFVDNDGTGYLHFGTFNSELAVKMQRDANTGRTSYVAVETMDGTADGAPKIYNMRDADALANIPDYDASKDVLGSDYANQVNASLTLGNNGGAYANGPKGFFEAAWVFREGDTYYNVYDGGKPGSEWRPAWNPTIRRACNTPRRQALLGRGRTKRNRRIGIVHHHASVDSTIRRQMVGHLPHWRQDWWY